MSSDRPVPRQHAQRFGRKGGWKPAPFQRPRIGVSSNVVEKREWVEQFPAHMLQQGDVVADVGKVQNGLLFDMPEQGLQRRYYGHFTVGPDDDRSEWRSVVLEGLVRAFVTTERVGQAQAFLDALKGAVGKPLPGLLQAASVQDR